MTPEIDTKVKQPPVQPKIILPSRPLFVFVGAHCVQYDYHLVRADAQPPPHPVPRVSTLAKFQHAVHAAVSRPRAQHNGFGNRVRRLPDGLHSSSSWFKLMRSGRPEGAFRYLYHEGLLRSSFFPDCCRPSNSRPGVVALRSPSFHNSDVAFAVICFS